MKCLFMLVILSLGYGVLLGQTRLNTEKLEQKLRSEITQFERDARTIERQAKALRNKAHASERDAEKARQELKRIDAEIARYRQKKISAFESVIEDLMNDAEIGNLLRKQPYGVFAINWIEEAILKEPWLLDEILQILKKFQ